MSTRNSKFLNASRKYKFLKRIYFFYNIYIRNFKFLFSNSQFGESKLIYNLFPKNYRGKYIDIGCFHPTKYNNTYLLYKKGWRGINIDLNPLSIELFNFFRSKDINLCTAISNTNSKKKVFFISDLSPENTIESSHKFFLKKFHNYKDNEIKTKLIKTVKLENILQKFNFFDIDLMNIDIEGHELKVLKSLNFKKFNVKVICIEILSYNSKSRRKNNELLNYLKKNGYRLKAKTTVNYILKKNEK